MGYIFDYWNIITKDNVNIEDAVEDEKDTIPATMPPYNSAYEAVWTTAETTYSIVYWINNDDGTKTYIGSRPVSANSADVVSGSNDLTASTNLCGLFEHEHSYACAYSCSKTEHTHTIENGCYGNCFHIEHTAECFSNETLKPATPSNPGTNSAYETIIKINNPVEGALYRYNYYNYFYNYVYISGVWYNLGTEDGESVKGFIWEGNNPNKDKYAVSEYINLPILCSHSEHDNSCLSCDKQEHEHSPTCVRCELSEHTHTASCKNSTVPYMEFVRADQNVTVEGDGSTIVNVYYQYKTYTFKFYYAKEENEKFYIPGGSTWAFAGSYNDIETQLSDVSGIWGQVDSKPTLNTDAFQSEVHEQYTINGIKGKYYYISLSAKYNEDISQKWPANPFNSVKTASTFDYGDYAYFSAWNVDANTWYDLEYENKTLKGNYQRLDYKLLIDEDTTTLNYLAFWENGKDNVGWNAPHKWIYNIHIPDTDGDFASEYNGVRYDLYGTYTIYDDNTATSTKPYCGQTPTALEGYELLTHTVKVVEKYDTKNNLYTYQIDFYYKANGPYSFSLYSYNAIMEGKGNGSAPFGMKLNEHEISATDMQNNYYPEGIEPGAYVFGGWYTTPDCIDGTEVDWDTLTMPDGNLTLYAKWTPVERTILFYSAYSDIQKDINDETDTVYHFMKAENVLHGSTLGSAYLSTPEFPGDLDITINGGDQAAEYDFVGWFYMDEDNKKKFAPDSMEVTRDLILFAEWQTGLDTEYEIQYVLKDAVSGTNTQDFNSYPAGYVIADTLSAHASVGQTKTFEAKSGSALYAPFAKHFFPSTNSHSILMEANPSANRYTFEYMYDDIVFYKIRYLEQGTNNVLHEEYQTYTSNAIISEKFKPINGYLPTSYYITRALQYDANATSAIEANTFTFYYVKDTVHGLYSVEHYIENIDSTDSNDPSNYSMLESIVGVGNLGSKLTVDVRSYTGFTHKPDMNTLITYAENGDEAEIITAESAFNNIIIEYTGVTVKIYYSRNEYSYTVKYVEYGKNALETIESATKYKYESIVTESAPNSIKNNGVDYFFYATDEKPQTQSLEIRNDEAQNEIVFYFKPRTYIVNYEVRCSTIGAVNFGMVTRNNSTGERIDQIQSATANALSSYEFVGWYDAAGTLITTAATYKPSGFGDDGKDGNIDGNITYYAYFAPIYTNLLVENKIADSTSDSFIFRIQGQGKLSYIDIYVAVQGEGEFNVTNLPIGSYTVTKLSDWSWNYTAADVESKNIDTSTKISNSKIYITLDTKSGQTVTFTNEADSSNWLNGEASKENVFN